MILHNRTTGECWYIDEGSGRATLLVDVEPSTFEEICLDLLKDDAADADAPICLDLLRGP